MKKRIFAGTIAFLLAGAFMTTSAFARSKYWEQDANGNWVYRMEDGSLATNAWIHDSNEKEWYMVGPSGTMMSGIIETGGHYYALDIRKDSDTYGKLLLNGQSIMGVSIQADTGVELEGVLSDATIAGLRGSGVDFSKVPSITDTKHVSDGVVRDQTQGNRGKAGTPLPAPINQR